VIELEGILRKEFARAARYRESFCLLLLEAAPTGEALGAIRDGVRLCDSVVPAGPTRVAVLLPETPLSGALQVATRLARVLAAPDATGQAPTLALGIGLFPSPQAIDAAALLRAASSALEQAASQGGGVVFR
jgi:GGDEF domain-containing protein